MKRLKADQFLFAWHVGEQAEPWRFKQYSRLYYAARAHLVDGIGKDKLFDEDWYERLTAKRDYVSRGDISRAAKDLLHYAFV